MKKLDFDVVVLGAGVVGVATAYWLAKQGKSVCVVDRQPQAGLETSFANGGQISVSHAEPWANPGAPLKVLKWLFDPKAPLLFRPKMDPQQWLWIAQFLVECAPHRANRNTTEIVRLATESRTRLQQIRKDTGIQYDHKGKGILHFYRDPKEFADAVRVAELMRAHGCDRQPIDAAQVKRLEPAFANVEGIVGATYTAEDESGDAKKFTQGLAKICETMGVTFLYGAQVVKLRVGEISGTVFGAEVVGPEGYCEVRAQDTVVSLGCHSAPFLRPYGVHLNIYPAKGYSVTVPVTGAAPTVSLTDDEYKLVYSNYDSRLRIAGTAELSGYSRDLNYDRCEAIIDNARNLFPDACAWDEAEFWTGLRPTTPSNVPYVGPVKKHEGLWLNTGHGTLGWTMAAGSGHRIAEAIG